VTTWHIPGTPIDIQQRQEAIETLYQEYALKPAPAPKMQNTGGGAERGSLFALPKEAANDEVLQQLLQGDTTGFSSPSNADFVLVLKLLHWTGDNIALTRKLFLASGLYREEKTERRTGSTTYLDLTIRNALTKRRNPPMKR
jgi:putative DNA primase/helicase